MYCHFNERQRWKVYIESVQKGQREKEGNQSVAGYVLHDGMMLDDLE